MVDQTLTSGLGLWSGTAAGAATCWEAPLAPPAPTTDEHTECIGPTLHQAASVSLSYIFLIFFYTNVDKSFNLAINHTLASNYISILSTGSTTSGGDSSETSDSSSSASSCPRLSNPSNGRVVFTSVRIGSIAKYICNYGYSIDGNAYRKCMSSGEWHGSAPTCKSDSMYY